MEQYQYRGCNSEPSCFNIESWFVPVSKKHTLNQVVFSILSFNPQSNELKIIKIIQIIQIILKWFLKSFSLQKPFLCPYFSMMYLLKMRLRQGYSCKSWHTATLLLKVTEVASCLAFRKNLTSAEIWIRTVCVCAPLRFVSRYYYQNMSCMAAWYVFIQIEIHVSRHWYW